MGVVEGEAVGWSGWRVCEVPQGLEVAENEREGEVKEKILPSTSLFPFLSLPLRSQRSLSFHLLHLSPTSPCQPRTEGPC